MEFIPALTGAYPDPHKPSLFELLSEQQLSALLPPTLRYLLAVGAQRWPRHLLRALNSFDELYALLSLVVERHYLLTRGGSFTEHFYGLKRERAVLDELPRSLSATPGVVREKLALTRGDVWRNLAVLVLVPYIRRKLDEAYEMDAPRRLMGSAYNRPPGPNAGWRERFRYYARWFLRNVYPSVSAAAAFATVAFNLAYLFDGSRFQSPLLWLIGTRVRRMTQADYAVIDALTTGKAASTAASSTSRLAALSARVLGGLSLALPASIFALKFLEWWHASDFASQLSKRAAEAVVDLPPPVVAGTPSEPTPAAAPSGKTGADAEAKIGEAASGDTPDQARKRRTKDAPPIALPSLLPIYTVPMPADSSLCPICGQEIATPTACQTGVVYCYSCIHRWLEGVHPRQEAFMAGTDERWGDEEDDGLDDNHDESNERDYESAADDVMRSTQRRTAVPKRPSTGRVGRWESGKGRCAVTGRRVLGGVEGLRRIMV